MNKRFMKLTPAVAARNCIELMADFVPLCSR